MPGSAPNSHTDEALPFASTGPYGHRRRMRERVIARGASVLADYELLEMLLFCGIPRGDTKPLAKALINQFGSFAGVLSAPVVSLKKAGMNSDSIAALRLSSLAAQRLGGAEAKERPHLGNWEALLGYFDTALEGAVPGQLRVLFLDNKNRLLADEAVSGTSGQGRETVREAADILRRALEVHATALILIRLCAEGSEPGKIIGLDEPLARELVRAGGFLAITLHDVFALHGGTWASLKQLRRL
ncbi:JAB domain-containing protein [Acetobacter sicerae]|uniref:JAB domain-containing protein n=1 Tax=Acetobacter sicerae TaxID=85325 RepID=UPI00156B8318|nr:RadC family protein [Acetobacter sicerae]NHN92260.1 DNA repair protein RadC [Acetobacter sicerae]